MEENTPRPPKLADRASHDWETVVRAKRQHTYVAPVPAPQQQVVKPAGFMPPPPPRINLATHPKKSFSAKAEKAKDLKQKQLRSEILSARNPTGRKPAFKPDLNHPGGIAGSKKDMAKKWKESVSRGRSRKLVDVIYETKIGRAHV